MPYKGTISSGHIQAATEIYQWIQENKHKFKNGVTASTMFSGAVTDYVDPEKRKFTDCITQEDPRYNRYVQLIGRMRATGVLRYKQETPSGKRVWSVNESILPPGTIDYTGVRTTIPEPPKVIPPKATTESLQKFHDEGKAFIEEELKQIKVSRVTIERKGVQIDFDDVTLYQLYKLGTALNEVTEPVPQGKDEESNYKRFVRTVEERPADDYNYDESAPY